MPVFSSWFSTREKTYHHVDEDEVSAESMERGMELSEVTQTTSLRGLASMSQCLFFILLLALVSGGTFEVGRANGRLECHRTTRLMTDAAFGNSKLASVFDQSELEWLLIRTAVPYTKVVWEPHDE